MTNQANELLQQVTAGLAGKLIDAQVNRVGEVTLELAPDRLIEVATWLRDETGLAFDQLIDIAGVDYAQYAHSDDSSSDNAQQDQPPQPAKLAAVYHLLSLRHNRRIRLRVYAPEPLALLESVCPIWPAASWFEREAFDLFGILFNGHPDLRRILTDYGFIGHPFRKDFPLVGHVEMFYDSDLGRVVYRPVDLENRVTVPRVIRDDHRYESAGE